MAIRLRVIVIVISDRNSNRLIVKALAIAQAIVSEK